MSQTTLLARSLPLSLSLSLFLSLFLLSKFFHYFVTVWSSSNYCYYVYRIGLTHLPARKFPLIRPLCGFGLFIDWYPKFLDYLCFDRLFYPPVIVHRYTFQHRWLTIIAAVLETLLHVLVWLVFAGDPFKTISFKIVGPIISKRSSGLSDVIKWFYKR